MKTIEKFEDLKDLMANCKSTVHDNCVLAVLDNKSGVIIQYLVVENPITFIRGIQDFSNTCKIPISDIDVILVGLLDPEYQFIKVEHCIISPYVYFKKAEEKKVSEGE